MPISKFKARKIAKEIVNDPTQTLDQLGEKLNYKPSKFRRQTVFQTIQNDTVQAEIKKEIAKLRSKEETQGIVTNIVDKLQKYINDSSITDENASSIATITDKILKGAELEGKYRGDFVDQRINISINTTINSLNDASKEIESDFDIVE